MVILSASIGKRCAVLLPKNFVNEQCTPSTGIVINRTLSRVAIILIEEVWQFNGLPNARLEDKIDLCGSLRYHSWGWIEVPKIKETSLVVEVQPEFIKEAKSHVLDGMIKQSVAEFKMINRI